MGNHSEANKSPVGTKQAGSLVNDTESARFEKANGRGKLCILTSRLEVRLLIV